MEKTFIESAPTKPLAIHLMRELRKTLMKKNLGSTFGLSINRIPGSSWWGVYVEDQ